MELFHGGALAMAALKRCLKLAAIVTATLGAVSFVASREAFAASILAQFNVAASGFDAGATDDPLNASFSFIFEDTSTGNFQDVPAESVNLTIDGIAFDTTNTAVDYSVNVTGSLSQVIFGGTLDLFGNERFAINPSDPTDFLIQLTDTVDFDLLDGSVGRQFMEYHAEGAAGFFYVGNFGTFKSGQIGTTVSSGPVASVP